VFTPSPPALRYKTHPLRLILDGVTFFDLGYSLSEAAQKIKAKHGYKILPSTLASWMAEHRELTSYARLRPPPPLAAVIKRVRSRAWPGRNRVGVDSLVRGKIFD
jgi:hypothetical protein